MRVREWVNNMERIMVMWVTEKVRVKDWKMDRVRKK